MMPSGRPSGRPSAAPDILDASENPMVADLFGVEQVTVGENGALVDSCMTGDINLAMRIEQAGTRFSTLNPESDDYADDLTELRAEFSGPVMDAIFEEVLARRAATKAFSDYEKAQMSFIGTAVEGVGGEHMAYLGLTATEGTDVDANDITYSTVNDNTMIDYVYETEMVGRPGAQVEIRTLVGVRITGASLAAKTDNERQVTADTTIKAIVSTEEDMFGWKTVAENDLKEAEAVLSLVTAGDLVLSTAEIELLQDVVRFRTDEIAKYDALITGY